MLAALTLGLALVEAAPADKVAKKKKAPPPTAVIAGTVFHGGGFALAGARVEVAVEPGGPKGGPWKTVSSGRGEFAVRVPPGPASYNVVVRANGYQQQEKKVTVDADERLDINFLLESGGTK
jgi:hypothetical protein